ncbi:MAG TPA: thioredoxin domain-containing protein [Fluviicola sp.]|nr:thioredoxin domain-containing protein [Fluviicola sp.]
MKQYIAILGLTMLTAFGASAQIKFEHITLDEAKAKAKVEKKPIFVDVYATWCGPCKQMAATAFVDPALSAYYNEHFINVKIDGEKEAEGGPKTMMEYGITAYPTLLYINADGTLFRKLIGGQTASTLMKRGKEVVDPNNSDLLNARKTYYSSKKEIADLKAFLTVMIADQADSTDMFAATYYNTAPTVNLADQVDLYAFFKSEKSSTSPNGLFFLEHADAIDKKVVADKIKEWINQAFNTALEQSNYSVVETVVNQLYPYWQKVETIQPHESYMVYLKKQFDRYNSGQRQ